VWEECLARPCLDGARTRLRNRHTRAPESPDRHPRKLSPTPKDRRNEQTYLPHIALFIAERLDIGYDVLVEATAANSRRFFRLPPANTAPL